MLTLQLVACVSLRGGHKGLQRLNQYYHLCDGKMVAGTFHVCRCQFLTSVESSADRGYLYYGPHLLTHNT